MPDKEVILLLTKRKIRCKNCKKSWFQQTNIVNKRKTFSNELMRSVYNDFLNPHLSFTTIAKNHMISVTSVINIFDLMVKVGRSALSTCISVDEFYFKVTDYNKYPCVISNSQSGKILDIVASRKEAYLNEYFSKLSENERNTVKYFVCDLNKTYKISAKRWLKNATIIVDYFHVTKLFTTIINKLRTRYMKTLNVNSEKYKFIKKYWKFFLKNPTELNDVDLYFSDQNKGEIHTSDKIFFEIKNSKELFEMYLIYKDFDRLFLQNKGDSKVRTENHLDFIINKCLISDCSEIKTLGNTLFEWYNEIVNSFSENNKYNISNGIAECNNNRIKKNNRKCLWLN